MRATTKERAIKRARLRDIVGKHSDMDAAARELCVEGLALSRAEGRRCYLQIKRSGWLGDREVNPKEAGA